MVIADSSVLIPLARTGNLELLRKAHKQVKIIAGVEKELLASGKAGVHELENAVGSWLKTEQLPPAIIKEAGALCKAENISEVDARLILIALAKNEELISNDYRIHTVAKTKGVKCSWLTTLLLECAHKKIVNKQDAKNILFDLVKAGMYLNIEVYTALQKKIGEI